MKGRAILNLVDALNVSWMDIFSFDWGKYSFPEKLVILGTALAILVAIAYYIVNWFRGLACDDPGVDDTFLTEFQQLKSEGKISSAEYDRVKTSAISESSFVDKDVAGELKAGLQNKPNESPSVPGIEVEAPDIEPNDAPPISLAEALARRKAEEAEG